MNFLITNDDGIMSDGLIRLARAAAALGEVWVVAPDGERSAASHRITLRDDVYVRPCQDFPVEGVHAFLCSGTPADCVRVACRFLMPQKPDAVLSGINRGYNTGTDLQYSATAGAAFEGAFQGYPSYAFSEGADGGHEVTDAYLETMLKEALETDPGRNRIWNINFPDCPLTECKGVKRGVTVDPKPCYEDNYVAEELGDGTMKFSVRGTRTENSAEGTDLRAVLDGYVAAGYVRNIG